MVNLYQTRKNKNSTQPTPDKRADKEFEPSIFIIDHPGDPSSPAVSILDKNIYINSTI